MKKGFRSSSGFGLIVTCGMAVAFAFFSQSASGGISATVSGLGAGIGDTIITGKPVTFNIHLKNNTGYYITGISNCFRLYSPEGGQPGRRRCLTPREGWDSILTFL